MLLPLGGKLFIKTILKEEILLDTFFTLSEGPAYQNKLPLLSGLYQKRPESSCQASSAYCIEYRVCLWYSIVMKKIQETTQPKTWFYELWQKRVACIVKNHTYTKMR